jgi:hypothetical protein
MIAPRCLIEREARPALFPECFADRLKWFHGRRGESARALAPIGPHSGPPNRTRTSGLPRVMQGHLVKEAAN